MSPNLRASILKEKNLPIKKNAKKGEYDVVKHIKYNNISIYFFLRM